MSVHDCSQPRLHTSWHDRAEAAVRNGSIPDLTQFLVNDPPEESSHFNHLLECSGHLSIDHQHEIRRLILEYLEKLAPAEREAEQRDWDAIQQYNAQKRREGKQTKDAKISFFEVFNLSLRRLDQDKINGQDTTKHKDISESLWEWPGKQDYLLESGCLEACARYGNRDLLEAILATIRSKTANDEQRRVYLRRQSLEKDYTALGWAILHFHTDCIKSLARFQIKPHLFEDEDACGQAQKPVLSVLHFALRVAEINIIGTIRDGNDVALREVIQSTKDAVEIIMKLYPPALCKRNHTGEPPYLIAKRLVAKWPSFEEIEKVMKYFIFEELGDSILMTKALYKKGGTNRDFALDMSDFNYDSHDFQGFVQVLENFPSESANCDKEWLFEDFLAYLVLPDLSKISYADTRDVLTRFVAWLLRKGVTTIIELNIPDNHLHPLAETFVVDNFLKMFTVHKLDWRKLDISLRFLSENETVRNNLRHLQLYSSTNWGVLHHWGSPDGLPQFPNLGKVRIAMVEPQDLERVEPRHYKTYRKQIETYMQELRSMLPESLSRALSFEDPYRWSLFTAQRNPVDFVPPEGLKILDDFENCHTFLDKLVASKNGSALKIWHSIMVRKPVRIAILDNGTDRFRDSIRGKIKKGISFTNNVGRRDNHPRLLPWYTAADAHGTQMAYLIHKVNPHCELYPIRVGLSRNNIDPRWARLAIEWALEEDIDIISISWTTKRLTKAFVNAVNKAAEKVLVFCSTADEGALTGEATWTSKCVNAITVSASDALGHALPKSQTNVDVMIDGDDIMVHGPRYMRNHSESHISGSSVATALAAGIASLCLCLARIANVDGHVDDFKSKEQMMGLFAKMRNPDDGSKIIVPSRIFGKSFSLGSGVLTIDEDGFKVDRMGERMQDQSALELPPVFTETNMKSTKPYPVKEEENDSDEESV